MSIEHTPNSSVILEEEDMKDVIERRKIKPEDFYILEELSKIPKRDLIMSFHNFFSSARERSAIELANTIKAQEKNPSPWWTENTKKMYIFFHDLVSKYDWTVAWNVEVALERRGESK